jgi:hypothetical protein
VTPCPSVTENYETGELTINWPDPRPVVFEISSAVFEIMVAELSDARMAAKASQ